MSLFISQLGFNFEVSANVKYCVDFYMKVACPTVFHWYFSLIKPFRSYQTDFKVCPLTDSSHRALRHRRLFASVYLACLLSPIYNKHTGVLPDTATLMMQNV